MSDSILRQIIKKIKNSEFYAIVSDETSDVAGCEQVSVYFRSMNDLLEPIELFLGFY